MAGNYRTDRFEAGVLYYVTGSRDFSFVSALLHSTDNYAWRAGGTNQYLSVSDTAILSSAGALTVYLDPASTGHELINSGTIRNGNFDGVALNMGGSASKLMNYGLISSPDTAIILSGQNPASTTEIENRGVITSGFDDDVVIVRRSIENISIKNFGTITAGSTDSIAYRDDYGGVDRIENSGTIQNDVKLGGGADIVINTGLMYNVYLGDGRDEFRGAMGRLSGGVTVYGEDGSDLIETGGGFDRLDGGTGADIMRGGELADFYVVDDVGDVIDESTGGSDTRDKVEASITFSLSNTARVFGDVENLLLTGNANINGTGNALDNTINGNLGKNTLYGLDGDDIFGGEGGGDLLVGGRGDDTYFLNSDDRIVEANGEGADRLIFFFGLPTYVLAAGVSVETMEASEGTTARNLTGNAFAQTMIGNSAANTLDGKGGNDVMRGVGGSDSYYVDSYSDIVDESVAGSNGSDTVRSSNITINLGLTGAFRGSIESAIVEGSFTLNLTGNTLANYLQGNAGNNIINGGGGSDTLVGLGGNDVFRFANSVSAANIDRITDYNTAQDRIELDNAYFSALPNGFLYASAFVANATGQAADTSDRIIYETDTGKLFYDSNGSAWGGTYQQFAQLSTGLNMTAGEFLVI